MNYWIYAARFKEGPFTPAALLSRTGGDLNVLAARGDAPPKDRWSWKLASMFPELAAQTPLL